MTRLVICHFSCGAASAVATKIAIARFGHCDLAIVNAFVKEEDDDNRRFLRDCEFWFDHKVTVVRNEKYESSAREVWRRERYMNGPLGASCSMRLKREPIEKYCESLGFDFEQGDRHVMGFVVDERNQDRIVRAREIGWLIPCVDAHLTHADCLGIVERAGLRLPQRYGQGYRNGNCVGCCKGGEKYWRKTRRDSPADFVEVSAIQRSLGPGSYFFRDRNTGERWPLDELTDDGPIESVEEPDCSFFCAMAEQDLTEATA